MKRLIHTFILLIATLPHITLAKSPDIQHWQTDRGSHVYFVHASELPILDISIAFRAGSAYDDKKFGLAMLTNNMLDQGSASFNATQIAEKFETAGAQFNTHISRDMALLTLRSLTEAAKLQQALDTLTLVLSKPQFANRAFRLLKKRHLAQIQQANESPHYIANRAIYHAIYQSNPYAHPTMGDSQAVKRLRKIDIRQFYEKYYTAKNATIIIVGAIDEQQARQISQHLTDTLPIGQKAAVPSLTTNRHTGQVQHIDFPSTQTIIKMGQLGITLRDPDYFPLMVGNHILGGGVLTSRLFKTIREDKGLSYSVYSDFTTLAAPGPFIISLGTRSEQAEQASDITQTTLTKFVEHGPTKQEVQQAKKFLVGNFPLQLSSNAALSWFLLQIAFYQLPLDYLDHYRNNIQKVSGQDIKRAFEQRIVPSKMSIVLVGKKSSRLD